MINENANDGLSAIDQKQARYLWLGSAHAFCRELAILIKITEAGYESLSLPTKHNSP
jgi:hypothetical protein